MRTESDMIGTADIPSDALYGIHAFRAAANFDSDIPFRNEWYSATGLVKKAMYITTGKFLTEAEIKKPGYRKIFGHIDKERLESLVIAAEEVARGKHREHFIVPAYSGGAGTSINMNINEIIANRALQISGRKAGDYDYIDPIAHANIFQSTNDVIPTALHLALILLLDTLESGVTDLIQSYEKNEAKWRDVPRLGFTQMQAAVPTDWGVFFASAAEALSRDRWRLSRVREKIKVVNLGGSAIGSGLTVPRFIIMEAAKELARMSGLPLARADHLPDATSNQDVVAEFHSALKILALNLEKLSSDIRLLGSDAGGNRLTISPRQTGSSVMPGKVNPVIPEFVIGIAHKVYGNDVCCTSLCAQGCLELNAYLPVIGHTTIESASLLIQACSSMNAYLLSGISIDEKKSASELFSNPTVVTALLPEIGYHKASELAKHMKENSCDVYTANMHLKFLKSQRLIELLSPARLSNLGFTISD